MPGLDDDRIRIEVALDGFLRLRGDPLDAFVALFDAIRPSRADDGARAKAAFATLLELLAERDDYREALRDALVDLFETRREVSFFTDAGILPSSGFWSELWRRIGNHGLPAVPDRTSFKDCVQIVFHHPEDDLWLEAIPAEDRARLWMLLALPEGADRGKLERLTLAMLEAMQILATRIAALGVEPEIVRLCPEVEQYGSPFLGLSAEVHAFVVAHRRRLSDDTAPPAEDEKQVLVLVSQCQELLGKAHRVAKRQGTTLNLTYLLKRLEQSLRRLELLARIVATRFGDGFSEDLLPAWTGFFREAVAGTIRSNSVRAHVGGLVGLLALRVTENAGRTGEHYIAATRAEYGQMWRAAAGAGLIIAVMALLKILAAKLELAPLNQAFVFSLNYAAGFVIILLLHFTIATKQPAMTAATIAGTLSQASGKLSHLDKLAALIVATVRSQIAAILGNVMLAFPTAVVVSFWLGYALGHPIVSQEKAASLLHDIDPLHSLAIPHAAIAGVYLFLAGLVSGYFDNRASYDQVAARIAALPWLRRLAGPERATRLGAYVDRNLGGLTGNVFFGFCLGSTGTIGALLGLPLDIRHIAFAAANFGYALVALDFALPWKTVLLSLAGIALIGLTNLAVSFSLALWVALRSRGASFPQAAGVRRMLWQRLVSQPSSFLFPPADTQAAPAK